MKAHGGPSNSTARPFLRTSSGHQIELVPNRVYVLGRDESCDLRVDDSSCSRRHARLSISGDGQVVHIEDLGSKNGTLCNQHAVTSKRKLADGDILCIGATTYALCLPQGLRIELDTRTTVYKK